MYREFLKAWVSNAGFSARRLPTTPPTTPGFVTLTPKKRVRITRCPPSPAGREYETLTDRRFP